MAMRGAAVCSRVLDMAVPFPHLLVPAAAPLSPSLSPLLALSQNELKRIAAHRAVDFVKPGMVLGLGTGSTAAHALDRIGDLLRSGELYDIIGIPTSKQTEAHATRVGIPLSDLNSYPDVDLSIDGADEVDPALNLVKGRGGSLFREKMIEGASSKFIVIVDESKLVSRIGGSGLAVPVEIDPFAWPLTLKRLNSLFVKIDGFDAKLRTAKKEGNEPFLTDNNNYIVDLCFENGIEGDLMEISDQILRITGVLEHGMFLGLATSVIVAGKDGKVRIVEK